MYLLAYKLFLRKMKAKSDFFANVKLGDKVKKGWQVYGQI